MINGAACVCSCEDIVDWIVINGAACVCSCEKIVDWIVINYLECCECEFVEWGGKKCVCVCVCVNVNLWSAGGRRGCVCLSCCGGQGQFACTNAAGRYLTLHLFSTCKM